ncbi:MAG: hypothetical protein ACP5E4_01795 [Candidatus Aenigmatarchaeota archaeon]
MMDMEAAVMVIIMIVAVGVAIGILYAISSEVGLSPKDKINSVFFQVVDSIKPGASYNPCKDADGRLLSQEEFQVLLQSAYRGDCGDFSANLQMSFSLTRPEIKEMLKALEIANKGENVYYRADMAGVGIGAVIIGGNPGRYPLKMWDKVEIKCEGHPARDLYLSVKEEGCDPYDENCEAMCSYMEDICDPYCYRDGQGEFVPCDIDCVDVDGDGKVTGVDFDGVCDTDCYNTYIDPERAYDPDCVKRNMDIYDGICDPDSNGVQDGICDPDCANPDNPDSKKICDPDCNGIAYTGNPKALLDAACYICDGTCNGFCSMVCKDDEDPDCTEGFSGFDNLTECCGNGKCSVETGEGCEKCPDDCPSAGTTCEDLGRVCCPDAGGDGYGCTAETGRAQGESCSCTSQCLVELSCTANHCCPQGTFWSPVEEECIDKVDVLIVALRSTLDDVYSDSQITQLENKIEEYRNALLMDGLGSQFLYLDDPAVADIVPGAKYIDNPSCYICIRNTLMPLQNKLENKYLVIIGGYSRFIQAPLGSYHGYAIYSDAYYGDINGDGRYLMDVAVGRFPDPSRGDMAVMINAMDTAIKLHNQGGVSLTNHISPIMSECGGIDADYWTSGRCFCQAAYGSDCQACGSCCGNIGYSSLSGRDYVMVLAHGPGAKREDYYWGGGLDIGTSLMDKIDVSDTVWMTMSCGGGHLKLKQVTSDSMAMSFLRNGGAVFIGSTNSNLGSKGPGCPVLGGDTCIGSLYAEIATRFKVGETLGMAYKNGKNAYYPKYHCPSGQAYHYHINCLYGDPTLKIKSMWAS